MECYKCFCVGPHECSSPLLTPPEYHCRECAGVRNPVIQGRTGLICLWCRSVLKETARTGCHYMRCPRRPVSLELYTDRKCQCEHLESICQELRQILAQRKSNRLVVPCTPWEWDWFKQFGGVSTDILDKLSISFW